MIIKFLLTTGILDPVHDLKGLNYSFTIMAASSNLDDLFAGQALSGRRKHELTQLRSEHAAFLSNDDRFIIQNATLLVPSKIHGEAKIPFRPQESTYVPYYTYIGNEPITILCFAKNCCTRFDEYAGALSW